MSKFSDTAKHILGTVAPLLGTAVGGPFGALAGTVLHDLFGTGGDDEKLDAAIVTATPDQLLALRKANNDFQIRMKELGISEEKLVFDDIASARAMQIATKDPTVGYLAWLMIVGFLVVAAGQIAAMLYFATEMAAVPPAVWLQIGNLTGFLGNEAKQAGSFFFGSSKSSQDKDSTIAEIAKS